VLNLAIIMLLQTEQLRLKQIILKFLYYSFNLTNALNVHAGPYAAYMVSGKTTNDSNLFTSETKLKHDFKRFDAGLSGGIGVDLDLVNFGVRYNYGLTKVFKEGSFADSDAKK
jgi:hypothetical protein